MQEALAQADPNLPFSGFYSMDVILATQLQQQRVEVLLLITLAGLALFLSTIGIYALVSNAVWLSPSISRPPVVGGFTL